MKLKLAVLGIAAAMIAALPIAAHHSFSAEYDSKQITVKGKFTHMDWINPHSWVHIDVVGADGKVTSWAGETPPPNGLFRNGWRKDSLKKGEEIEISGNPAKDGTAHMWASSVKLLDRQKDAKGNAPTMGFGSRPPTEGPQPAK
ncbi:MAG: DUF6152 family protein [Acidobacteriota bacterium]